MGVICYRVFDIELTQYYRFASIIKNNMSNYLPVHPEEVTKRLFSVLPKRTKDILDKRFGLGKIADRMTLDGIGKKYGITRERVRQIEADGLSRIRKSQDFAGSAPVFSAIENYFENNGRVIREDKVLEGLSSHPKHQNHIYFLLTLHNPLSRFHENEKLHDRWVYGKGSHEQAEKTLSHTVEELKKAGSTVSEPKLFEILTSGAKGVTGGNVSTAALSNWLALSKLIAKNYFGEWGLTEFSSVKPRGVRDLSHMVLGKHGKPLHFSEVAAHIGKLIGKKVHVQTVHNELIKDQRFVLVGRGLYALKDWGYEAGTVKDIISNVLKHNSPATKEKIVSLVSQKRFVKPNTILINLENKKYFKRLPDGRYTLL